MGKQYGEDVSKMTMDDILPPLKDGTDSGYIIHGVAYPSEPATEKSPEVQRLEFIIKQKNLIIATFRHKLEREEEFVRELLELL